MSDFDDGSVQLEDEQLERVQVAEEARHAQIEAVWSRLPEEAQNVCKFIHEKIMAGKFDGPNPHNHINFLNQTRDIWLRRSGIRQESSDD